MFTKSSLPNKYNLRQRSENASSKQIGVVNFTSVSLESGSVKSLYFDPGCQPFENPTTLLMNFFTKGWSA